MIAVRRVTGWKRTSLVVMAVAAQSIVLPACSMFGDDEEEINPPAELVKFDQDFKIRKVWSAGIGDGTEFLRLALSPASDGTAIYAAAHDGRIASYDAKKGKKRWTVKSKLPLSAGPAVGEGVVVAGSSDGDVIALDAASGRELWRTTVSSEVLARPAIAGGKVFLRTVDGKLTALDLINGAVSWMALQSIPRLTVRGTGAPVVRNNLVVCGFDNGKMAAYDVSDGTVIWEFTLIPPAGRTEVERLVDLNTDLHVVGSDIYVVGYQGRLASVALETGQILWMTEVQSYSGLAADFNNLYVSTEKSELVAVARRTGRELWRHEILANRDISGPVAYGGSVVVGDFEGYLHWFEPTSGKLQSRTRAGKDHITMPPVVVDDMIYVQSEGGSVTAFRNPSSGG